MFTTNVYYKEPYLKRYGFFIVFFLYSIIHALVKLSVLVVKHTMFTSLVLIIWWVFACYGLIVANMKTIKDEFDMIIPYQWVAWILLILFFFADLFTIGATIKLLSAAPLFWILQLVSMVTKLVLWFVLTYWLITKYFLVDHKDAKEKTDTVYKTLVWIQVPFGVIAIMLWILWIVFNLMF